MPRHLTFDASTCLGCKSCELACALCHSRSGTLEGALGESPRPEPRVALALGPNGLEALRCEQCQEPLCTYACKSGGLSRDAETGAVTLDAERCVACWMCVMVCPHGVRPSLRRDHAVRCDLCAGRAVPACVEACPTRCLGIEERAAERVPSDFAGRVVVVGSSAAGIGACEAVREHAPGASITLLTADLDARYSRPLLSYLLGGRVPRDQVHWRSAEHLAERLGVWLRSGVRASGLDAAQRELRLSDGTTLGYDRLVLATGARSAMPEIPGIQLPGVFPLRDLGDADGLLERLGTGKRAVVLGGGNVGLQAAEALHERGLEATVIVRSATLLSQMVDEEAGRRVGELFERNGVRVRTGRDVGEVLGDATLRALRLDDGSLLPADLLVVGKGIRPDVAWLAGSGLAIGTGIVVDRAGRTNLEHVLAAGDCAETIDPVTGLSTVAGIWPVAYEMGHAAGCTAVGVERPAAGALRMNSSRFFGVPVISLGEVRERRLEGAEARVLTRSATAYRKLVTRRGRLVGALLYGDITGAGTLYRLYRSGRVIDPDVLGTVDDRELERVLGPWVMPLEAVAPEG
jgi:nitrite reductase (NADH) large subunit